MLHWLGDKVERIRAHRIERVLVQIARETRKGSRSILLVQELSEGVHVSVREA
jgi:hypothetical protein